MAVVIPLHGIAAPSRDLASAPVVPSTYGDLAFERMQPIFAQSMCTSYLDDFLKHDRGQLTATAVPGMDYIWSIGECGPHLVLPGSRCARECVDLVLKSRPPESRETYHVRIHANAVTISGINDDRARYIATTSWGLETTRSPDPFGRQPATFSFLRDRQVLATASISARYEREGNRGWVGTVHASIPSYLSAHTQMVLSRLMEEAMARECQTLFCGIETFIVNEMDVSDWREGLTRLAPTRKPGLRLVKH